MRADPEPPLRSELYSADQMEQHGRALAGRHPLGPGRRDRLLARLADNEAVLTAAGELLKAAASASRRIAPAGEWLLDNFYLIEEQVRTARRHLPGAYSRELPHLLNGSSAGLPRVYDIALEAIAHGDGRVDVESLRRFVAAYQSVAPLKLGELWAIPIMLRLALLENLRRVASHLAVATTERDRAGAWADQMLAMAAQDPKNLILVVADMARSKPPVVSSFVAELARRLQGQSAALALTWIQQRLAESGTTIEQLVQAETQDQAADQVSMSNSIGSLRVLGATDWREFVETLSVVERTLREDPVYGAMDFATRDRYRHAVERLAKDGSLSEVDVARRAIAQANSGVDERRSHVGYYLVGNDRSRPLALPVYLGAVALASGLFTWGLAVNAQGLGANGWTLVLVVLACVLATSHLAVALVNRLAMALAKPHPLPRLDYSAGIPPHSRTLVVVPALLVNARQVEDLLEALEVRFLANRDAHLHFGLLSDFTDAQAQTLPQDAALERLAADGIEALNRSYGDDRFFLFHRPRRWNPGERLWMGYERKRGKQAELNSLLRGKAKDRFSRLVGEVSVLAEVKYVITLDTDTQLPRDAARELAGAMAHPLNRPRHDERTRRVCEGYAILQPRVAVSLPASGHSRFAQLFGGEPGIDPYTRTVSDLYQDLFGEGSFIGKGIYDVDAFERALEGRFRENRILSHDLLEGCHARSGLLSDVQLYEEYPPAYGADMSRRHRWIRGDWQIAHWIFAPLSPLSRWKLLDNLRRSLVPAAIVLLLIGGWAVLSDPAPWTLAVLAILLLPPLVGSLQAWRSTGRHFAQAGFALACLPHEAFVALDALARTAWRLLVTRRRLLEWTPADEFWRRDDLPGSFRTMWIGPTLACATAIYLAAARPLELLLPAAPVLLLWLVSPVLAWWISRPLARDDRRLSAEQEAFLHAIARKTWSFFETFVVAEDHWLPPDNFQEFPAPVVAHRTSPTNMGLALLANLSAYDFGFITVERLIERTASTLGTMQRLERFRGHFYNWYDTRTLAPLPPLYVSSVDSGNLAMHLLTLRQGLLALRCGAGAVPGAESLAKQAGELAQMEYGFLFDAERRLLAIGYNVSEGRRDAGYYDLLASEARATCFVAIALGELPQESWFALGRLLTSSGGKTALLSWSGSMFEYLMPLLVMPAYDDTLLDQTCRAAVARQIDYGNLRRVPWGMSESGYNRVDAGLNYQYRAFGVPGLGLKRGLSEDLVIAPYASALALMVAPEAACANLERLAAGGLEGPLGFYEAIDYTPSRVPRGQESVVVRSYMAHHQGMVLLSLAHLLLDRPMQKRFAADPRFRATLLLLQERIPKRAAFELSTAGRFDAQAVSDIVEMPVRVLAEPNAAVPEVQLLSNGRYHVMVSHAGGGYSRWKDLAVTRWREDTTCDNWGSFCYVRDTASGEFWSSAHQPTLKRADAYEAIFSEARAEFRRHDLDYETHTEIVVSPEDDIELRRLRITNRAKSRRTVEITSYAEVVLAPPAADALHPAFSNLFLQTEIAAERQAILCTRRPRSVGEHAPWMFHAMTVHGAECSGISYETDRARFIGRGRSLAAPQAMREAALSGSQGAVLDPIVAIRQRVDLAPEQSAIIDMVSGIGESREAVLSLACKYQDRHLADRVFDLAWTHSLVTLRQINATESDAQLYGRLAGSVLYANASLRDEAGVLAKNRRGQSGLWGHGISGDLPIVLLRISEADGIDLVRQLVQAHAYWRMKGLAVDLMIWNEDHAGYRQVLQDQIMGLIAAGIGAHVVDRPGGIFVRRAEQIADEDRILIQSVARAVLSDKRGTLAEQINRPPVPPVAMGRLKPSQSKRGEAGAVPLPGRQLVFFNGLGGFTPDGREYVITTSPGQVTPAPWVNVLANPQFGSVISESGLGYTWSENAHESRLTPWGNDPVGDASGEAFYLRDEETGMFWSPTPLPCRGEGAYVTRHGFGYSVFEHTEGAIRSELKVYVDLEVAVKYSVLKITNDSGRPRRLSATGYVEWVLGDLRSKTAMHVVTEIDPASGALCARNSYSVELAERVAFFDVDDTSRSLTADRSEFLGRNGTLGDPAALRRVRLSNRVGAAYDPCGAIQVPFELAPGEEREVIFRLGVGGRRSSEDAGKLARRLRGSAVARSALDKVEAYWARTLGAVQVETPDPSLDVLANGWLVYQTLACRLWGRSGYYQSGGAFGFRDQLQDSMALVHAEPALAREQLLRAASRQFVEGDVQHWWHPPSGRGVRTHCSDDFLWLPAAACRYVLATGDAAVLDEPVAFLEGRQVNAEDDSYYDLPARSGESATLYEHCERAILRGLRFGGHGLPLIGSGDWNDGMNMVGAGGKGESIWLGFFLYQVLLQFATLAAGRGDTSLAARCRAEAQTLRQNLEQHGWDGGWYRRAYFDDGTPLGSAANAECQIDSIAQSWSVLSGAGDAARSRKAMQSLDQRLVRREHRLVQLLDPPFDTSDLNPGYIKGYVSGVRENGGQYTHAAVWAAMAFAEMGDSRRAWELATMINPVNHGNSAAAVGVYKVEPYVVAADVYAVAPHIGRGGWTWYTGSAGWMYRLFIESLLGVRREGDTLRIAPCLPADWPGFRLRYRYGDTVYDIRVHNDGAEDGAQSEHTVALVDDGRDHRVELRVGIKPRLAKIA